MSQPGAPKLPFRAPGLLVIVAAGLNMLSAARCAWLDFVAANRFHASLVPLGGFLVLILFLLFQERISNLPRRIFQVAIAIFIFVGVVAVIYETQSPQECAASPALSPNRRVG